MITKKKGGVKSKRPSEAELGMLYSQMTAKEIAVEMYKKGYIPSDERNFTAPRLTELSIKGIVEPVEKKKCEYTGKTVSVYKVR